MSEDQSAKGMPIMPNDLPSNDPVLSVLHEAESRYRAAVDDLQEETQAREVELAALRVQIRQARDRERQERERADGLAAALRDVHQVISHGDLYALILQVCLRLTGATRGLYITAGTHGCTRRVRAAVGIEGYPQSPPSSWLDAICQRLAGQDNPLIRNRSGDHDDLPLSTPTSESFQNFLAAPVLLLRDLHGVIVVADKPGEFDGDDAQTLLHVGSQAAVAAENIQLRQKLQNAYLATVSVLADAIEAKDPYTQGHCEMVSRYAGRIGRRLALDARQMTIVRYAALLHDIGKIGVSDGILNKPGPLLPAERDLVRSHVRLGHDLILHVPALAPVADAVLHHHEWYDGTGYPDGLRGAEIPVAARIVCVVDSYGAMISRRSYKEAYGGPYARAELSRCAGTQFDPEIVDNFLAALDEIDTEDFDGDREDDEIELAPLLGFEKEHTEIT